MIRKKKSYVRPKKPFEKERIQEENEQIEKYGLKNKKEVWKALARVNYYRGRAKKLVNSSSEEQEAFFNKLNVLGLKTTTTAEVLALKIEDLLKRRLPSVLVSKKLATTAKQARQMVVHKNILINGKVVNSPSYIVPVSEESQISLKKKAKKAKPKPEETPEAPETPATKEAPKELEKVEVPEPESKPEEKPEEKKDE
jgi:small subunit ribosomal protein S4